MAQEYRNFIGGEWVASSSGATIEVRNPADTDEVIGTVPASTVEDVRAVRASASGIAGVILGRALYDGRITPEEAIVAASG